MTAKIYWERHGMAIYHGDALDVLPMLSGIDLVLADAPYSSGGMVRSDKARATGDKYRNGGSAWAGEDFSGDSRDQRSYQLWTAMWARAAWGATRPSGTMLSFIDDRQLPVMMDGVQVGGWVYRQTLVWDKTEGRSRPTPAWFRRQTEFIVAATKGPIARTPDTPGRYNRSVFQYPPPGSERQHQTQKPVELLVDLITTRGDWRTVCDPFMGSGSTLVAAARCGRRGIGVELSKHNCDVAIERVEHEIERLGKVTPESAARGQQLGLLGESQ